MKKRSTVYAETANLIETHGLANGKLEDDFGRLCAVGAMSKAISGDSKYFRYEEGSNNWLVPLESFLKIRDTVTWSNDNAEAGTPEVVIEGFRNAADYFETVEKGEGL